MTVRIRLARSGAKKRPYYRIVVAAINAPRDGKFIEKIGTYNPMLDKSAEDRVVFRKERVEHWLAQGAQPTERVCGFITKAGIKLPAHIQKKVDIKAKAQTTKPSKKELKASAK